MRRTVWTLLTIWLLQLLLAGSAWARWGTTGAHAEAHAAAHAAALTTAAAHVAAHPCHNSGGGNDGGSTAAHNASSHSPTAQHTPWQPSADSHHCCAVGLGLGVAPQLAPLPQAAPHSVARVWVSLSTRPDLRPPI